MAARELRTARAAVLTARRPRRRLPYRSMPEDFERPAAGCEPQVRDVGVFGRGSVLVTRWRDGGSADPRMVRDLYAGNFRAPLRLG